MPVLSAVGRWLRLQSHRRGCVQGPFVILRAERDPAQLHGMVALLQVIVWPFLGWKPAGIQLAIQVDS